MKTVVVVTFLLVVGCALTVSAQTTVITPAPAVVVAPSPQPVAVAPGKYTGDAWTWDSARSIVTLDDGGRQFRVQVTPDQIARLRHHDIVTVTGTLLGPEPIDTVLIPAQAMSPLPNGPAATADIS